LRGEPLRHHQVIAVCGHDGAKGMAHIDDPTMREAYARFWEQHSDRELRKLVRKRTARQWIEGAQMFASSGERMEALRYRVRALLWSI